jgi:hypothetical protein
MYYVNLSMYVNVSIIYINLYKSTTSFPEMDRILCQN